jgi:hypothetical protein
MACGLVPIATDHGPKEIISPYLKWYLSRRKNRKQY